MGIGRVCVRLLVREGREEHMAGATTTISGLTLVCFLVLLSCASMSLSRTAPVCFDAYLYDDDTLVVFGFAMTHNPTYAQTSRTI
jgi:hypothetical protein